MKKIISALVTLLTLTAILPLMTASAYDVYNEDTGYGYSCVDDDFGVFSDNEDELYELNQEVQECSEKLGLNIYIFIAGENFRMSDSTTPTFCGDAYDKLFGAYTDGVFFFIDMSGKTPAYDYVCTSGKAIQWYSGKTDAMREATYDYLPSSSEGNYAAHHSDIKLGIEEFLYQLKKYKRQYDTRYLRLLPFGGAGWLIVTLIGYFIGKSSYKFKDKTNPRIYVSSEETNFAEKSDTFIRTYTTRTKIESSSGGGHHGGGGGHHGGSGGHR